jgi:hypothetical protein
MRGKMCAAHASPMSRLSYRVGFVVAGVLRPLGDARQTKAGPPACAGRDTLGDEARAVLQPVWIILVPVSAYRVPRVTVTQ